MNSLTILDFINDCFKIAYLYFGTIQTVHGPVVTKIVIPDEENKTSLEAAAEDRSKSGAKSGDSNNKSKITTAAEDESKTFHMLMKSLDESIASASSEPATSSEVEELLHAGGGGPPVGRAITAEQFERALLLEDGYNIDPPSSSASSAEDQTSELDGERTIKVRLIGTVPCYPSIRPTQWKDISILLHILCLFSRTNPLMFLSENMAENCLRGKLNA